MNSKEVVEIILEYIKVFLSWPVIFLIVALLFIFKFKESIKLFLENIASIKVGPFEASQRQAKIPEEKIEDQLTENLQEQGITLSKEQIQQLDEAFNNLSKEKETKEQEIADKNQAIRYFAERAELYELAYLSVYLVYNSKLALFWFYNQTSSSSTKENFISQFILFGQVNNPFAEKESIFNALLVNELLEQNGALFKISEKGIKFLRYNKLII